MISLIQQLSKSILSTIKYYCTLVRNIDRIQRYVAFKANMNKDIFRFIDLMCFCFVFFFIFLNFVSDLS